MSSVKPSAAALSPRGVDLARALVTAPSFVASAPASSARGGSRRRAHERNEGTPHVDAASAIEPLVIHVRDFVSERPVSRQLFRALPRHAVVLANSRAVAEDVRKLAPRLAIEVVYNAIDVGAFRAESRTEPERLAEPRRPASRRSRERFRWVSLRPTPGGRAISTSWSLLPRARTELGELPVRFYVVGGSIYSTRGLGHHRGRARARRGARRAQRRTSASCRSRATLLWSIEASTSSSMRARAPSRSGAPSSRPWPRGEPVVVARAGGASELFDEGRSGIGFTPGNPDDIAQEPSCAWCATLRSARPSARKRGGSQSNDSIEAASVARCPRCTIDSSRRGGKREARRCSPICSRSDGRAWIS